MRVKVDKSVLYDVLSNISISTYTQWTFKKSKIYNKVHCKESIIVK